MSFHCIVWYCMVLYCIRFFCTASHCHVPLLQRAGELPRSASNHFDMYALFHPKYVYHISSYHTLVLNFSFKIIRLYLLCLSTSLAFWSRLAPSMTENIQINPKCWILVRSSLDLITVTYSLTNTD